MIKHAAALAFLLSSAAPLVAGDAEYPVEARVLEGWVMADGSRMAALDIRLAPGWKTYWRAPGDAGIPPTFDWSASRNLGSVVIAWPTPIVFDQNGMRSLGYSDRLVLPLSIEPARAGKEIDLVVSVDMGVCSDVCLPYRISVSGRLDTEATRPTPEIAGALAQRPYSQREAGVTAATCRIAPIADGLRVETRVQMPSAGGLEVVVIEPGLPDVWVSEAETRREGRDLFAVSEMVHIDGGIFALDRSNIRITVLGESRAVEVNGCNAG